MELVDVQGGVRSTRYKDIEDTVESGLAYAKGIARIGQELKEL